MPERVPCLFPGCCVRSPVVIRAFVRTRWRIPTPLYITLLRMSFAFSPLLLYNLLKPGYVWVYASSVILVFTEQVNDHKRLKVVLLVDNNLAQNDERSETEDRPKFYAKERTPRPYLLSIKWMLSVTMLHTWSSHLMVAPASEEKRHASPWRGRRRVLSLPRNSGLRVMAWLLPLSAPGGTAQGPPLEEQREPFDLGKSKVLCYTDLFSLHRSCIHAIVSTFQLLGDYGWKSIIFLLRISF